MDIQKHITGIIIAGGKSSRMGTDKGFLEFKGKPFISYSIDALSPYVDDIIIVSNDYKYDVFNLKRVNDCIENAGPLAAVYSGLLHSKTEDNIILSCDIPLINKGLINKIINQFDDQFDIIQVKNNSKSMPLIAAYKKRCLSKCMQLLIDGERRLRVAVKHFKTKTIPLELHLQQCTMNVNTPNEFQTLKTMYT